MRFAKRPLLRVTALAAAFVALAAVIAISGSSTALAAGGPSEHARIVAFWTPERMARAVPRDFVRNDDGSFSLAKPSASGKPGGGSGGGTCGSGNTTGASWNCGGKVKATTGKVFFTLGTTNYVCSGSVVDDGSTTNEYSLVLSAGHCTYDEVGKKFATNWVFVPDYDAAPSGNCATTLHGCWTASSLVTTARWASNSGDKWDADWAFAKVGAGGKNGTQLDATVGAQQITTAGDTTVKKVYAFGYPAAGRYNGTDFVYCAGNDLNDPGGSQNVQGLACNMTGGSSGGPWFENFATSSYSGTVRSLTSFSYTTLKGYLFGPVFNSYTATTLEAAKAATSNTTVAP